jgi:hypothetical protein
MLDPFVRPSSSSSLSGVALLMGRRRRRFLFLLAPCSKTKFGAGAACLPTPFAVAAKFFEREI